MSSECPIYAERYGNNSITSFPLFIQRIILREAKACRIKSKRLDFIRHSHISLLIDMGFSAVAIADRVGHEGIDITYQYAHLFSSKQTEMADRLDDLGKGEIENVS